MSQQNSESQAIGMGIAFIGVVFAVFFFVLYAVACFVAIVLTIVALCAFDREIAIFGQKITPNEARIFLGCGLLGLVGVPVFALFCAMLLQSHIPNTWWPYLLLGGYSFGAVGISAIIFDAQNKADAANAAAAVALPPPAPPASPVLSFGPGGPSAPSAPSTPTAAFRFASWEDEMPRAVGFGHEAPDINPAPDGTGTSPCADCPYLATDDAEPGYTVLYLTDGSAGFRHGGVQS